MIQELVIALEETLEGLVSPKVAKAMWYARTWHRGQTRRNGDPYVTHPIRVAERVHKYGEDHQVAALLHDILEDTACPEEMILTQFGLGTWLTLDLLTHDPEDTYPKYIKKIEASGDLVAIRVKLADLEDNLADSGKYPPFKYLAARTILTRALRGMEEG